MSRFELKLHRSEYVTLDLGYERTFAWTKLQTLDWSAPSFVVTDADVAWLDWARQELALSPDASSRFRSAIRVTGHGTFTHPGQHAFIVSLDDRNLYGGILLAPISAMGIRFPVIYVNDRPELVELQIRPVNTGPTPYEKVALAARSTIELPALREHFAGARELVGVASLPATFPSKHPSGSADYDWVLALIAKYRSGELSFADVRARVLSRRLPPHPLGCEYLLVSPPPPPAPHVFEPTLMPSDWAGTWGEVAMAFLLGGLDATEYELLHRAAHAHERA